MYTPIDATNHGYHYQTIKVLIPDFIYTEDGDIPTFDDFSYNEWLSELKSTLWVNCPDNFFADYQRYTGWGGEEQGIATGKLVQVRIVVKDDNTLYVIIREAPHDYYQYIHNLSPNQIKSLTSRLFAALKEDDYNVSLEKEIL